MVILMRRVWRLTAIGVLLLACGIGPATAVAGAGSGHVDRPKIGLALSGGGARGAAHVGVLRVLEQMRIPVDYIAGTSMGSIIAGLYASGLTPDEIENALETMDWDHIFDDRPPREDRSFRRKRDDDLYLIKAKPGYSDGELKLPSGLVQGQKFDLALSELTQRSALISDFDKLPIPFRAVATDIGTGKSVVLSHGDLAIAMRASMAVPGAFAATVIDGQTLVDGGITNNLPISVVREMGADIVIAVDISTPLMKPEEVRNVLKITEQLTSIMTRTNTEAQIATLGSRDVLIVPDLGDIGSADFTKALEAVEAGRVAAEAHRSALAGLSLNEGDFQRHIAARAHPSAEAPIVHFVRIDNRSQLADGVIRERLHVREGEPLDTQQLEHDIGNIYGMELFESVRYQIVEEDGKTGILVEARERSWGPNYLQFGLALTSELDGEDAYNIGVSYLKTGINPLAGELRFAAQFGSEPGVGVDWYQPLDFTSNYFVESQIGYWRPNYYVFDSDGDRLAQYRVSIAALELSAGRDFDVYGEARIGYRIGTGSVDREVGAPELPEGDFDSGSVFARLSVDRLDNVAFPEHGYSGSLEYALFREGLGNDSDLDQLKLALGYFETFGAHTVGLGGTFNTTVDGAAAVQDRFRMGGFFNLSGYSQDSISGQHSALLGTTYYRRFTGLKYLPWYVGGTLEFGNVWEDKSDISWESLIASGSVFLGADTPLGPFYIGYGHAEAGRQSIFMSFGKTF